MLRTRAVLLVLAFLACVLADGISHQVEATLQRRTRVAHELINDLDNMMPLIQPPPNRLFEYTKSTKPKYIRRPFAGPHRLPPHKPPLVTDENYRKALDSSELPVESDETAEVQNWEEKQGKSEIRRHNVAPTETTSVSPPSAENNSTDLKGFEDYDTTFTDITHANKDDGHGKKRSWRGKRVERGQPEGGLPDEVAEEWGLSKSHIFNDRSEEKMLAEAKAALKEAMDITLEANDNEDEHEVKVNTFPTVPVFANPTTTPIPPNNETSTDSTNATTASATTVIINTVTTTLGPDTNEESPNSTVAEFASTTTSSTVTPSSTVTSTNAPTTTPSTSTETTTTETITTSTELTTVTTTQPTTTNSVEPSTTEETTTASTTASTTTSTEVPSSSSSTVAESSTSANTIAPIEPSTTQEAETSDESISFSSEEETTTESTTSTSSTTEETTTVTEAETSTTAAEEDFSSSVVPSAPDEEEVRRLLAEAFAPLHKTNEDESVIDGQPAEEHIVPFVTTTTEEPSTTRQRSTILSVSTTTAEVDSTTTVPEVVTDEPAEVVTPQARAVEKPLVHFFDEIVTLPTSKAPRKKRRRITTTSRPTISALETTEGTPSETAQSTAATRIVHAKISRVRTTIAPHSENSSNSNLWKAKINNRPLNATPVIEESAVEIKDRVQESSGLPQAPPKKRRRKLRRKLVENPDDFRKKKAVDSPEDIRQMRDRLIEMVTMPAAPKRTTKRIKNFKYYSRSTRGILIRAATLKPATTTPEVVTPSLLHKSTTSSPSTTTTTLPIREPELDELMKDLEREAVEQGSREVTAERPRTAVGETNFPQQDGSRHNVFENANYRSTDPEFSDALFAALGDVRGKRARRDEDADQDGVHSFFSYKNRGTGVTFLTI